jgi:hypothetical protein
MYDLHPNVIVPVNNILAAALHPENRDGMFHLTYHIQQCGNTQKETMQISHLSQTQNIYEPRLSQ